MGSACSTNAPTFKKENVLQQAMISLQGMVACSNFKERECEGSRKNVVKPLNPHLTLNSLYLGIKMYCFW